MSAVNTLSRFNVALITGGGGGLGKALAKSLINNGKKVIIAGRTTSNLEQTAKELGPPCLAFYTVDVGNLATLPAFAAKVINEHPDVDCLINNAGISTGLDFTKDVDFSAVLEEVNINVLAVVQLCALFTTHLQTKPSAVIMNVASGLAYTPIKQVPVYCATKAFVKSFTQSLRAQFHKSSVFVIELSPPLVDSNLGRNHPGYTASKQPHCLTQEAFIKDVEEGWKSGSEEVGAGTAITRQQKWRDAFEQQWKMMNQIN